MTERIYYIPIHSHQRVLADKAISCSAKVVLTVMLFHVSKDSANCKLKNKTMVQETGLNRGTVYRAVDELVEQGIIEKTVGHGFGKSNVYAMNYIWGNSMKIATLNGINSATDKVSISQQNSMNSATDTIYNNKSFNKRSLTNIENEEIEELKIRLDHIQDMTDDEKHTYLSNRQQNSPIRTQAARQHPLWQQLYETDGTSKETQSESTIS